MTRPIFIVGCPRSGTTLLRDLLRSHPNLTLPPETQLIPRFYRAYGDPSSDREAWLLARRILQNPRIASWGISTSEADFAGCRSFSGVIRRLFEVWAAKEGKPRWGDKTPHNVRHLPLILRLFPEAQVIHIIRDGRDAALSWIRAGFEPRNLYVAARMWNDWVAKGRRDGALLPPGTYFELRYETLLAEPEAAMRGVCDFLNEHYFSAVLTPNPIQHESGWRIRERTDPAFRSGIVRTNSGGWRSAMNLRQRTLFESVAGGLLAELGYPVEGLARPLSRAEKLLWETDHRLRFLLQRLRWLRKPHWRRLALSVGWAMVRPFLRPSLSRSAGRNPPPD